LSKYLDPRLRRINNTASIATFSPAVLRAERLRAEIGRIASEHGAAVTEAQLVTAEGRAGESVFVVTGGDEVAALLALDARFIGAVSAVASGDPRLEMIF